ncbi:uncharacterized protein UV8b_04893 [Ustilaginoidea virens]|uniref:Uncharacterized protein n=1 Tax=Ustilaginoidea virens TaxID=1159556 RepID=A0A063BUM7_USTVR|nr:uncharacterized protein UV8b_04893 [Ustilaginoidea virens]QUC20652.1 hypothetical protein UV8b_04893 [Ustilaginoidea virens]GAO15290.1 hypothetical protein UVI_02041140 [Ustilaginoidea virens]
MPSDLAKYLASQYLVADPKPASKHRRKRKPQSSSPGLVITDDDLSGWSQPAASADGPDEELRPTVAGATAEFRKARKNNWRSLQARADNDQAAADAVLASTAAERHSANAGNDENPVVENLQDVVKMSDGTHAGLQTAAAVSAQIKKRQREERDEFRRHARSAAEEETVYRDATGRRVDVSTRKAEAAKAAAEAEAKESAAREALKGRVQLDEARKRRERLENAKLLPFSHTAEDEDLNREQMDRERWNDPMAKFMTDTAASTKANKASSTRPVYAGAAPPNRYGIKPGYRWDGVDRGIGFEAERFKALNRRERIRGLNYSWQMDE